MLDAINTYLSAFILCFYKLHICVFIPELVIEESVLGYLIKQYIFCVFGFSKTSRLSCTLQVKIVNPECKNGYICGQTGQHFYFIYNI